MSEFLEAGLGTLAQLKARVFPALMESYDSDGEWDTDLKQIGLATAGAFNRYCNRDFERKVGATYSQSAGMSTISLDRYPVESISAMSLLTGDGTDDILDAVHLLKSKSGLVELTGYYGCYRDQLTVTFTGGFFLGDAASLPSGATALPNEIFEAWVLQSQSAMEHANTLRGAGVQSSGDKLGSLPELEMLRAVRDVLDTYKRYR